MLYAVATTIFFLKYTSIKDGSVLFQEVFKWTFVMVFIDTLHPTKFPLLKYFRKSSFLSWFEI